MQPKASSSRLEEAQPSPQSIEENKNNTSEQWQAERNSFLGLKQEWEEQTLRIKKTEVSH
jgi:hypothetical protein